MIQDISPSRLRNEYIACQPEAGDNIFMFNKDGKVLLGEDNGRIVFTDISDLKDAKTVYLFSVDETRYFLAGEDREESRNT